MCIFWGAERVNFTFICCFLGLLFCQFGCTRSWTIPALGKKNKLVLLTCLWASRVPLLQKETSNQCGVAFSGGDCWELPVLCGRAGISVLEKPQPNSRKSLDFLKKKNQSWPFCYSGTCALVLFAAVVLPNHRNSFMGQTMMESSSALGALNCQPWPRVSVLSSKAAAEAVWPRQNQNHWVQGEGSACPLWLCCWFGVFLYQLLLSMNSLP